jgi:L-fuconolactonase
MVFLQCEADFSQYREEAAWVAQLAEREPRIRGMVPWAPLEQGKDARSEVAALARNPLVKGIRRIIQFEPEADFCLQAGFVDGIRLLADFGLHFEFCLKGDDQFRNALILARNCPEVRFVLDHIGKPFIVDGTLEPWKTFMQELAALPNTWCKISGLVNEADLEQWTDRDLKPYIHWAIHCFGWDRVMYGGDWPVSTLASTYPRWVEALARAVQDASVEQQRKLFHDNAVAFYRLSDD